MKNRFNWVFEILRSEFFNAAAQYARGIDPRTDRDSLRRRVEACIASARERAREFPDEPQYDLFLGGYAEILEELLRRMPKEEDLPSLLADTKKRIIALEDDIRIHLK
jgi:hypothetical protein